MTFFGGTKKGLDKIFFGKSAGKGAKIRVLEKFLKKVLILLKKGAIMSICVN